jgi:uncharacterized phage infection (PIP) family protein YhgE
MNNYEPWMVAAVYLMQSVKGRAHYTNIVNYIVETELTELIEKSAAVSQTVNITLKQKVIDGRAVFKSEGNGYYSLDDEDAMRKNAGIRDIIRCLKDKDQAVVLRSLENNQQFKPDDSSADDSRTLSNDARKLSEQTRKLSDETKRLSDETMKLSNEVISLSDENKNLLEETAGLRRENQQLKEKLQSISQLCD